MPEATLSDVLPVKRLTVGLTNLCNLDCDYCLRVAETQHLDFDLLHEVLRQARDYGVTAVTYTGGEVLLHPRFQDVLRRTAALGLAYSFVTNGWHFPKAVPVLCETKAALYRIFQPGRADGSRPRCRPGQGIVSQTHGCDSPVPVSWLSLWHQHGCDQTQRREH